MTWESVMSGKDAGADLVSLGKRIRGARLERSMTLENLAKTAGVSKSVLSQVERGTTNPTLSTLWNVAKALALDPLELFGGDGPALQGEDGRESLISLVDSPVIDNQAAKYRLVILNAPELAGVSELYRLVLRSGGVLDSKPHERGAVEQLTVLSGEVEVRCGSDRLRLQPGRTARYAADVAHAIAAVGKRNAEALLFVNFVKSK
jgi:transcriptional regulator with XRE-family HTH domain